MKTTLDDLKNELNDKNEEMENSRTEAKNYISEYRGAHVIAITLRHYSDLKNLLSCSQFKKFEDLFKSKQTFEEEVKKFHKAIEKRIESAKNSDKNDPQLRIKMAKEIIEANVYVQHVIDALDKILKDLVFQSGLQCSEDSENSIV